MFASLTKYLWDKLAYSDVVATAKPKNYVSTFDSQEPCEKRFHLGSGRLVNDFAVYHPPSITQPGG